MDCSINHFYCFDVFNTILNMEDIPYKELAEYSRKVHHPQWERLSLPDHWRYLQAYDGAAKRLAKFSENYVCAFTNCPSVLLMELSWKNNLRWDAIIPLEVAKVFKPDIRAYELICDFLGVMPAQITVVTANKDFGDIEQAKKLGMNTILTGPGLKPL